MGPKHATHFKKKYKSIQYTSTYFINKTLDVFLKKMRKKYWVRSKPISYLDKLSVDIYCKHCELWSIIIGNRKGTIKVTVQYIIQIDNLMIASAYFPHTAY